MMTTQTKKNLKRIVFFAFLIVGVAANAQEQKEVKEKTYSITEKGGVNDLQPYIDALNNSDMRNHRLLNKRYTIVFEKGVKVELFSAAEIAKNGLQINVSEYPEKFELSRQEPIFALGANNYIIEYHISSEKR
ncbi:MAG: hypothetical protein H0X46_07995 [Bacteroidetes bacterium]|nr:hypothetical protein [Bacteroidota bacterium]